MATVLHRINGGEVLKIALNDQPFDDRNQAVFGVLIDPARPDGDAVRDLSGADPGPLRVLGFAKHWDGTNVRNATAGEIAGFATAESQDEADQDAEDARSLFQHPRQRKMLKYLMREINILRVDAGMAPRTAQDVRDDIRSGD